MSAVIFLCPIGIWLCIENTSFIRRRVAVELAPYKIYRLSLQTVNEHRAAVFRSVVFDTTVFYKHTTVSSKCGSERKPAAVFGFIVHDNAICHIEIYAAYINAATTVFGAEVGKRIERIVIYIAVFYFGFSVTDYKTARRAYGVMIKITVFDFCRQFVVEHFDRAVFCHVVMKIAVFYQERLRSVAKLVADIQGAAFDRSVTFDFNVPQVKIGIAPIRRNTAFIFALASEHFFKGSVRSRGLFVIPAVKNEVFKGD